ncbi:MAG: DNA methyltransferase [Desulfurococcaceae archaeon]
MEIVFREIVKLPSTTYATHGLYMYPAKFIPHVVRYVIEKYSKEGDWIFDPFAGYGTVAIEATLTNRNALLWDLNPITEVLTYASTYRGDISLEDFEINWEYDNPFHPRWKNILYWHPKEFYDILSKLWGYWHFEIYDKAKKKEELQKAYLVAIPLFKITRYFSYSDEKISKLYKSKYAIEKVNTLLSVNWKRKMIEMYWNEVRKIVKKIEDYKKFNPRNVDIEIKTSRKLNGKLIIFDAIREKLDRDVNLMITSPPYLQAQEYIRSFKLELAWLGFSENDLRELRKHEIPYNDPMFVDVRSRQYRELRKEILKFKNDKLLKIFDTYFRSLICVLNNIYEKTEIVAIFTGPVKVRTLRIPIDEIIREHLEFMGFRHVETLRDKIVVRRLFKTKINPATGLEDERTPTEHLLVMRK